MNTAERIEALIARFRATRYPDGFLVVLADYLAGRQPLADLLRAIGTLPASRRSIEMQLLAALSKCDRLDELDLRILDFCLATHTTCTFVYAIAERGPVEQFCDELIRRGLDEVDVLGLLCNCARFVTHEGVPTAVGRLLLGYVAGSRLGSTPARLLGHESAHWDALLQAVAKWGNWTYLPLARLLLAARPPYIDLAWQVAQQINPSQAGEYAAALLQADPDRFTEYARSIVTSSGGNCDHARADALRGLMAHHPARHVELAVAMVRATPDYAEVRRVGLETAFLHDSDTYWPLIEDAVLDPHLDSYAVHLLARVDFERARPTLQRCVALGNFWPARTALETMLLKHEWEGRQAYALSLLAHRSKQIRDIVVRWLAVQGKAALDDLTPVLAHTNADARLAAVTALRQIGGERAYTLLGARLDVEKSQKVQQAILDVVGAPSSAGVPDGGAAAAVVAAAESTLKRVACTLPEWFDMRRARMLRWCTGEPVPDSVITFLFYRQSRAKRGQLDPQIRDGLALIDPSSSDGLALWLWESWLGRGAPAREAWLLPLIGRLGNDWLVPRMRRQIDLWGNGTRRPLAFAVVGALVHVGSDLALAEIDDIATRSKKGKLGEVAARAFNDAATQLGISCEELLDRATPRLGFDARGERVLDYGARRFTMRLGGDGALQVYGEDGRRYATLPAPRAADDVEQVAAAQDEWKLLRSQIKLVTKRQLQRLERAMVAQRVWSATGWCALFLEHPILLSLACGLIWAATTMVGGQWSLFRPLEDGSLTDADDEPVTLSEDAQVWLAHPALLDAATRTAWQRHLADYQIESPFPQLTRLVVSVPEEAQAADRWDAGRNYVLAGDVLRSRCEKVGWHLGETPDGGYIHTMWRHYPKAAIDAVILLVGDLPAWDVRGSNVGLGGLAFFASGANGSGSRSYISQGDTSALRLGDVPMTVFSEAAADLQLFAAAGTYDPKWELNHG